MSKDFVRVANTRIKRSNIKAYGVEVKRLEGSGLIGAATRWMKGAGFTEGLKAGTFGRRLRYLYITTYQNDNFTFCESEVDIDAIMLLLDREPE